MLPKEIVIFITFASLLSLTHDVLAYPAADQRPRSQSPDYDGSGYEQSAGQNFQTRCSQGFKKDDRGECVTLEEIPSVSTEYGNLFTSTSSTTEPSGSPKTTVLDKLIVIFVVVLFFVR